MIGCTLFLLATLGLGLLIRSLETGRVSGIREGIPTSTAKKATGGKPAKDFVYAAITRALCFLVLTINFIVPELRSDHLPQSPRRSEQEVLDSFPAGVGSYRLTRTWAEHDSNGLIALAMGEYATQPKTGDAAKRFTFGLWVGSANHLVAYSKVIQGIQVQWTGSFDATAQQVMPIHFVTSFYDDGISSQYDAESICSGTGCSGHVTGADHKGFFFEAPGFSDIAFARKGKSLPILLRREWLDGDPTSSSDLRAQFEADARRFMAQVDLRRLLDQNGSQPASGEPQN